MNVSREPWDILKDAIDSGDEEALRGFLRTLSHPDKVRAIFRLAENDQADLFALLQPEEAAKILQEMPSEEAADVMEDLQPRQAAAIVDELASDQRADLLADVSKTESEAILHEMQEAGADAVRHLLDFPPHSAGGLMVTEFLSYSDALRVADVFDDLRENGARYSDFDVQYAFIQTQEGRLAGVLPLRDMLFSSRSALLSSLMIPDPHAVRADAPLEHLRQFFQDHRYLGAPVVDDGGRLVGVVRRSAVEKAAAERANKAFLRFSGIVGGEEFRSMPFFNRSSRRLSWLSMNIVLNVIAASVIAFYQDTLAQAIALAVFLPVISDMSGCSGNQAVAVSMRELTLGLIRPRDMLRVFLKEFPVGMFNGIVLGLLLGLTALIWNGNPYLGLVVGAAMAANTLVSVCVGGVVPIAARALRLDPALVSSPMLTTITDMCGFFFVLSLATLVLPRLA
jgi:magnesium transporter